MISHSVSTESQNHDVPNPTTVWDTSDSNKRWIKWQMVDEHRITKWIGCRYPKVDKLCEAEIMRHLPPTCHNKFSYIKFSFQPSCTQNTIVLHQLLLVYWYSTWCITTALILSDKPCESYSYWTLQIIAMFPVAGNRQLYLQSTCFSNSNSK